MSRSFTIQDVDWGDINLFVIHYDPSTLEWEEEWDSFRTEVELIPLSNLFSKPSYNAYQDALHGHALPLIKELGLKPSACFLKAPKTFFECQHKKACALYDKNKCLGDKTPPSCFQATIENNEDFGIKCARIFDLWRQGIYILVVPSYDPFTI